MNIFVQEMLFFGQRGHCANVADHFSHSLNENHLVYNEKSQELHVGKANLSGLFETLSRRVGGALQHLHLDHAGNRNERHEPDHEQRQLPAVDETDDDAGAQRRQVHEERADARSGRAVHETAVRRQTSAQRTCVVLVVVKVTNFL